MWELNYWPHTLPDVHTYIEKCFNCRRHQWYTTYRRPVQLISPDGPLQSKAMDILSPVSNTNSGTWFVVLLAARFCRLTRTIPTEKATAKHVAEEFWDAWVMLCKIAKRPLTNNKPQFDVKFFFPRAFRFGRSYWLRLPTASASFAYGSLQ